MAIFSRTAILILVVFSVPFLMLISPDFLKIQGVEPSWPVILLLPLSLETSPFFGVIFGLILGTIVDTITLDGASYIPSLTLLGFWWGSLGKKQLKIDLIFNFGLLAFLGTGILGLSFWIQKMIFHSLYFDNFFHAWAFHTFLAEMIITGLIAPLLCSWILMLIKKGNIIN